MELNKQLKTKKRANGSLVPIFIGSIFCDGLRMIDMYTTEIVYDKPIYVGTPTLDLSKLTMTNSTTT